MSERQGETRLGVDVGGTFTDLVALSEGALITAKVPSTPRDQSEGVMNAIETSDVEPGAVLALAHGMTVATNALLERRGDQDQVASASAVVCGSLEPPTDGRKDLVLHARALLSAWFDSRDYREG